jgi:abortive infection bacteriophage resistance protein
LENLIPRKPSSGNIDSDLFDQVVTEFEADEDYFEYDYKYNYKPYTYKYSYNILKKPPQIYDNMVDAFFKKLKVWIFR